MANTYFQFKQFIVHQEKAAMKVCTDACLFGAWVAEKIQKSKIESALDIGTGTGLLSLMLAQKTDTLIDAIEIDEAAAQQASANFKASPWDSRLKIHATSIQQFNQKSTKHYDVIVSNPPFFEESLRSNNEKKNLAKHTRELSFEELSIIVSQQLKIDGAFYILLPYHEFQKFNKVANAQNLFLKQQVNIRQTDKHIFFRTIGVYSKEQVLNNMIDEIEIKINNEYSPQFIELLKDYYLHL
jgi:tRNA1Val (adenine37-N6)-methyltransferase